MTGIEKIIEKIEYDCKDSCDSILSKARAQAQDILEDAKKQAADIMQKSNEAADNKCLFDVELAQSKAEHEHKKYILEIKNNIIKETIDESIQKIRNLPADEYFNFVFILIEKYARPGHGIIKFSDKDLNRIPKDFNDKIKNIFKEKDKSLEISNEAIKIDGGFVLIYNEIEQNCSFSAIVNDSQDEIKDMLYDLIFMRN